MMATFHRIKITDRDGSIIYDDLIYRLPLKEYAVQHKCTEIYILDLKYMLYRKKILTGCNDYEPPGGAYLQGKACQC